MEVDKKEEGNVRSKYSVPMPPAIVNTAEF
jgi:hypothetical protein